MTDTNANTTDDGTNSNTTEAVTIRGDEWPANTLFIEDRNGHVWAVAYEGEAPDSATLLSCHGWLSWSVDIGEWPMGLARLVYTSDIDHIDAAHHTDVTYEDFMALFCRGDHE